MTKFQFNDGGREQAGYKGKTGDCVTRAIAIAAEKPYQEVYDTLKKLSGSSPRDGMPKKIYLDYLNSMGWEFVSTMKFGQGCKVHLTESELPSGRIIVRLSKHLAAVVDGIIQDTYDCSRGGRRCVYGYFRKKG